RDDGRPEPYDLPAAPEDHIDLSHRHAPVAIRRRQCGAVLRWSAYRRKTTLSTTAEAKHPPPATAQPLGGTRLSCGNGAHGPLGSDISLSATSTASPGPESCWRRLTRR